MWNLYTKWTLSPTRLFFWVEFSCLVRNMFVHMLSEPYSLTYSFCASFKL
ncbi:hypothetical protein Hanom_Chr16g01421001 [Helianthus anomalus]